MADLEAENIALKVQLTQYYQANCALSQQLNATQTELMRALQLLNSVLIRNKAAEKAMRAACMMMPTTISEAEN